VHSERLAVHGGHVSRRAHVDSLGPVAYCSDRFHSARTGDRFIGDSLAVAVHLSGMRTGSRRDVGTLIGSRGLLAWIQPKRDGSA
jgi:hypothetical protein